MATLANHTKRNPNAERVEAIWRQEPGRAKKMKVEALALAVSSLADETERGEGAGMNADILRECASRMRTLHDTLLTALPYVEQAEIDPAYKKGAVAKVVRQMLAALGQ